MTEDVQGRVNFTPMFHGAELNTEYLFGLFASLGNSTNDSNASRCWGYQFPMRSHTLQPARTSLQLLLAMPFRSD